VDLEAFDQRHIFLVCQRGSMEKPSLEVEVRWCSVDTGGNVNTVVDWNSVPLSLIFHTDFHSTSHLFHGREGKDIRDEHLQQDAHRGHPAE
jgi:hypothetical protein